MCIFNCVLREHIACCKRPSNWASNFFSIMKPPFAQRVAGSLLGEHYWKTLCHLSHCFTKVEVCLARRSIGVMAGGPLRPRGARWGPPSSSQLPWPTFLREGVRMKKTFLNGHCPYRSHPPHPPPRAGQRATWSFFSAVKNDI